MCICHSSDVIFSRNKGVDAATIVPVETTAAWVVGGLVVLVGGILAFVQKLILHHLETLNKRMDLLQSEMLTVMEKSLDTMAQVVAANGQSKDPPSRPRRPPT